MSASRDSLQQQATILKSELNSLRNHYTTIKFKYENHKTENQNMATQIATLKNKNSKVMHDITKVHMSNSFSLKFIILMLVELGEFRVQNSIRYILSNAS